LLSFDLSAIFTAPELAMRKGSADNDRGYLAVINHLVETGDDAVHHGHTDPPPDCERQIHQVPGGYASHAIRCLITSGFALTVRAPAGQG
jgi:hypothetical protein